MRISFIKIIAVLVGLYLGSFVSLQQGDYISFSNSAFAQCSAGPCNGQTECVCNGTGGTGASCCGGPGCCCCSPPPPPETDGCTGGCPFATGACSVVEDQHVNFTRPHWDAEMLEMGRWYVEDFFAGYLLPSMMAMTEELTAAAMHQVTAIGAFFDADSEIDTHRLLRDFHAQAHKDYHPSEGVCAFATNVRSLSLTEQQADLTQSALNTRAMGRHMGIEGDNAAEGVSSDFGLDFTSRVSAATHRSGRLRQFQDEFCSDIDNNTYMSYLCDRSTDAKDAYRLNQDTDFYELFGSRKTIDVNFLQPEGDKTQVERDYVRDFFALNKNLYGHKVPYRLSPSSIIDPYDASDIAPLDDRQEIFAQTLLEYRSLLAKRNVTENTFHAQAAMKAQGDSASTFYMQILLQELGLPTEEIVKYIRGGPSYNAQMEILTRKIYQNPQFFVNLYDKPANVSRQNVSLKAIGLMQDWDIFETTLRTEMLSSILLELALKEKQEDIQGR